jgi:para-aminobenzoate synthetase component 1
MLLTTWDEWEDWSGKFTLLPCIGRFPAAPERFPTWERVWKRGGRQYFVLESGKEGRYSFLGLDPASSIRGKGNRAIVDDSSLNGSRVWEGTPLDLVRRWMSPYRSPRPEGLPKFLGGCVGYWGYDVIRSIERIPEIAADDLSMPDYCFARFDRIWVIDHLENSLYCCVHSQVPSLAADSGTLRKAYETAVLQVMEMKALWDEWERENRTDEAVRSLERRLRLLSGDSQPLDIDAIDGMTRSFTREEFKEAVRRIQQYISAGDVFQVNLSVRQSRRLRSLPEEVYEWLRLINPSPYMGYLNLGELQLVSGSPELLVQLEGNFVRTRPIAGTRRRGKTPEEDQMLSEELLSSEKERAEHIMLVDLERNDLGRICKYGSVKVKELMAIERYSHVMHIVSEVHGELAEGKDAYDVIAATFPGGTITGAPKIRTMEIIEELEPVRRGVYTGSIGWIDYSGNMEFNIIIRTLAVSGGMGHVQAGAGIVIDSVPEREYKESLNKTKAMWKAILCSEQYK